MSHYQRIKEARAARKANGLNDTFAEQTRIRDEIGGMKRFLDHIATDDIPDEFRAELKERVQEMIASHAETLYHLTETNR